MNPFNQNEIMVTGDGINPMKIDLNPWTDGGAVEVEKQLNTLYDQLIKQEKENKQNGIHKNLFAGKDTSGRVFDIISGDRPTQLSFSHEDLASANEGYKDYGIEIKHVDNADGKSYYQIYKNGEPQIPEPKYPNPPGLNVIGVQDWLSNNDNWSDEERVTWADNNVKAVEEEVENRKKIQERVHETISDEQIELEYKKSNQRLIDAEIAFEKISDDAKKIIQSHLTTPVNRKDGSFEEEENWEATKFDSLFSDEVRDQLSEEDQIIFENDNYELIDIMPKQYNSYNSTTWFFNVNEYECVLFPSKLRHQTNLKHNDSTRISLAFNSFIKGVIGTTERLTEIKI